MRSLPILLLLACVLPARSQSTPESLLGQLPSPPPSVCDASAEELRTFEGKLSATRKVIDDQMAKCRQQEKEASKQLEGRMKAQTMQAQTGMSMGDVQKLKTMTKEEKRAWAMGNMGSLGPRDGQAPAAQPFKAPGAGLSLEELKEQKRLLEENLSKAARLQARYLQLEKEYRATQRPLEPKRDYSSTIRPADPICQEFTKRYKAILADHLAATRQLIQDARRLDALTAKQYGLATAPGAGSAGFKAVQEYAHKLGSIAEQFRR